ncbi:MAG: PaaI family thioesterase [Candidatus Dormibacteraeota bacterium]|nr:PaaI family thioesterase [Candidatus Dormibacteraeota bacterium]
MALSAEAVSRSGREALEGMMRGELPPPPIATLLGFRITGVGDGEVEFTCTPDESMYNPIGAVHGGVVCTLLDSVVGCAVHTTLSRGLTYISIDLQVSYLRAVTAASAPLVASGRVTKPGRRVAFAAGEVRDGQGKLVASGSGACLVMSPADGR